MATSIFIAKFIGAAYLVFGIGILANPDFYRKMVDEMLKSYAFIYAAGVTAFITGFLIVTLHNVWEYNWTIAITVSGWLALLKGIYMLAFPKSWLRLYGKKLRQKGLYQYGGIFVLIVGIFFGYFGYIA